MPLADPSLEHSPSAHLDHASALDGDGLKTGHGRQSSEGDSFQNIHICLVGFPQKLYNLQSQPNEASETTRPQLLANILPQIVPEATFSSFHISFMSDSTALEANDPNQNETSNTDTTGSIDTFEHEAICLLKHLHEKTKKDDIILAGYGFGGILIKLAILLANEHPQYHSILSRITELVFVETVHRVRPDTCDYTYEWTEILRGYDLVNRRQLQPQVNSNRLNYHMRRIIPYIARFCSTISFRFNNYHAKRYRITNILSQSSTERAVGCNDDQHICDSSYSRDYYSCTFGDLIGTNVFIGIKTFISLGEVDEERDFDYMEQLQECFGLRYTTLGTTSNHAGIHLKAEKQLEHERGQNSDVRHFEQVRPTDLCSFLQSLSPTKMLFYEPPRSELEWSIFAHFAPPLPVRSGSSGEQIDSVWSEDQGPCSWEKPVVEGPEESTWVLFCGKPDSGKTRELAYYEQRARARFKPTVVALSARYLLRDDSCVSLSNCSENEQVLRCLVHQIISQLSSLALPHLLRRLKDYQRLSKGDWSESIWWKVLATVLRHGESHGLAVFFDDLDEWLDASKPADLVVADINKNSKLQPGQQFLEKLKNLLVDQEYGHLFFFSAVKSIEELGFQHLLEVPPANINDGSRTGATDSESDAGEQSVASKRFEAIRRSLATTSTYCKRSLRIPTTRNSYYDPAPFLLFVYPFRIGARPLEPVSECGTTSTREPMSDEKQLQRMEQLLQLVESNRRCVLLTSQEANILKARNEDRRDKTRTRQYLEAIHRLTTVPVHEKIQLAHTSSHSTYHHCIILSWVLLARQPLTSKQLQFASVITARTLMSSSAETETMEELESFIPMAMNQVSYCLDMHLTALLGLKGAGIFESATVGSTDFKLRSGSSLKDRMQYFNSVCFHDRLARDCLIEADRTNHTGHGIGKDTKDVHYYGLINHSTLASVCLKVIQYYFQTSPAGVILDFDEESEKSKPKVELGCKLPESALQEDSGLENADDICSLPGLGFRPPPASPVDKAKETTLDSMNHFFHYAINNWHYHYLMSKRDINDSSGSTRSGPEVPASVELRGGVGTDCLKAPLDRDIESCLNDKSWRKCWYRNRKDYYHSTNETSSGLLFQGKEIDSEDITALEMASELGLIDIVNSLLHHSSSQNVSADNSLKASGAVQRQLAFTPRAFNSALLKACRNSHEGVIRSLLLSYPAIREQQALLQVNHWDSDSSAFLGEALAVLAERNLANTVSQFLSAIVTLKEDAKLRAILEAARAGSFETFKTIREHGAGIEWETLLRYRPSGSGDESLDGQSVFHCAAIGASLPIVKYILKQFEGASLIVEGFDDAVDKNGRTPLMVATHLGYYEIVQALLGVSSTDPTLKRDHKGNTALHYAADRGGNAAVFHSLLKQSRSWDQSIEFSVLETAFRNDQITIVKLLLRTHPSPSTFESVAQLASRFGWLDTLRDCLERVANARANDDGFKSELLPFDLLEQACVFGQPKIVEFLLHSISKTDSKTWESIVTATETSPTTGAGDTSPGSVTENSATISKATTEATKVETSGSPVTGASYSTSLEPPEASQLESDSIDTALASASNYYARRMADATAAGSLSSVRLLLDAAPKTVFSDSLDLKLGGTLLATATFNGHYLLVLYYLVVLNFSPGSSSTMLLKNPPFNPGKLESPEWNPSALFVALAYRRPLIFELLFNYSNEDDILSIDNLNVCCLLHHAAFLGDTATIRRILGHPIGAILINYVDNEGHLPLRYGLWDLATTKLLLPRGYSAQLLLECNCYVLPFNHAVEDSNDVPDVPALLLEQDIRITRSAVNSGVNFVYYSKPSATSSTTAIGINRSTIESWERDVMRRAAKGVYTAIQKDYPNIISMVFDKFPRLLQLESRMQLIGANLNTYHSTRSIHTTATDSLIGHLPPSPFLETACLTRKPKVLAYLLHRLKEAKVQGAANRIFISSSIDSFAAQSQQPDQSLLLRAVTAGWEDIVSILLSNGADANDGRYRGGINEKQTMTPLFRAVMSGFHKIARILLENGARVGDHTLTHLYSINEVHMICWSENPEAINAFLEFPDDLFPKYRKTMSGKNLLMETCQAAKPIGVAILLNHKSGIGKTQAQERDNIGRSALDYAVVSLSTHQKSASLLLKSLKVLQILLEYKEYRFPVSRTFGPIPDTTDFQWYLSAVELARKLQELPQLAQDPAISQAVALLEKRAQEEELEANEKKEKEEKEQLEKQKS